MQPTFFIPHGGGPCFFMDWTPPHAWDKMRAFLEGLVSGLVVRPRAILVITAHWETDKPMVTAQAVPDLVYDYYGFPPHTYQLTWPAPGDPALAGQVVRLLADAGIDAGLEAVRGFDHGVFIPMKLALPGADTPTVAMSLRTDLDPAFHLSVGAALRPLRNDNVLIIGSGLSYHNLGAMQQGQVAGDLAFNDWLSAALTGNPSRREAALKDWQNAPSARRAHPREEHLAPVFVAAGAATGEAGTQVYSDIMMGARVSGYRFGPG